MFEDIVHVVALVFLSLGLVLCAAALFRPDRLGEIAFIVFGVGSAAEAIHMTYLHEPWWAGMQVATALAAFGIWLKWKGWARLARLVSAG